MTSRKPKRTGRATARALDSVAAAPSALGKLPSFATQLLLTGKNKNNKNLDSRRGSLVMQLTKKDVMGIEEVEESKEVKSKEEEPPKRGARDRMSIREVNLLGIDVEDNLFEQVMGISVTGKNSIVDSRRSSADNNSDDGAEDITTQECTREVDPYNVPFDSKYRPDEMRCLALVAHNHMKPAMKDFVLSHKEILKKFRLTGTNTTMTMLKHVFGDDPKVMYGPTCQSGPLGGDAELCALMCLEDLGGIIFFVDPLSAHPHQADIDSLLRLSNVHNIITAPNPASAHALCFVLKCSLEQGRKDKIPSFFYSLQSPGVKVYKEEQKMQVQKNK